MFHFFCCLPLNYAEAERILEVRFHGILRIAIALDNMDTAILGVQNLSSGRPSASTLAPWAILSLGDTLGGHRSSSEDMWGPEADF